MTKTIDLNLGHDNALLELLTKKYNLWAKFNNVFKNKEFISVCNSTAGFPSFHYTDIASINSIENSVVLIDCLTEGIHCQDLFKEYNKSNFYIIFSNSIWDIDYYKFGIDYINLDHYLFLNEITNSATNLYFENYYSNKKYNFDYPKENVFVSTVGNSNSYRDFLVNQLVDKLDYQNFILKYQGKNFGRNCDCLDFYRLSPEVYCSYKNFESFDFFNISVSLPIELYNSAYFNLVVETDTDYQHSFFPTEKVSKAILCGIPFVIFSTPNFLKNLQQLGFTTYSDLWDESYDLEPDYQKRSVMIAALCNQLNHFDWNKNKNKLRDIAYKNADNLLRNNSIFVNQFEKINKVLDILSKYNFEHIKSNKAQLFKWLNEYTDYKTY
jgi:hypothetical protein